MHIKNLNPHLHSQLRQVDFPRLAVHRLLSAAREIGSGKDIGLIAVQFPGPIQEIRIIWFHAGLLENKVQNKDIPVPIRIRN